MMGECFTLPRTFTRRRVVKKKIFLPGSQRREVTYSHLYKDWFAFFRLFGY